MSSKWFPRLGDVPGIDYISPLSLDRTRLRGHDVQGEVRPHTNIHGEPDAYVVWNDLDTDWESRNGWAPVREHLERALDNPATPTKRLLQRLWEGLELPGEPVDYHWVLGAVLERLWSRRLAEPEVLTTVETLAWVHIRLTIAFPRECLVLVRPLEESGERYNRVQAFQTLIRLYVAEGFLQAALEVAELEHQHFPVKEDDLADVRSRLAGVGAEADARQAHG